MFLCLLSRLPCCCTFERYFVHLYSELHWDRQCFKLGVWVSRTLHSFLGGDLMTERLRVINSASMLVFLGIVFVKLGFNPKQVNVVN